MQYLGILDIIWVPVLLFLVHVRGKRIQAENIDSNASYRYYHRALAAKVYGGLAFAFVYMFYYKGGDTLAYWMDAKSLGSLIFRNPVCYLDIMMGNLSVNNFYCFDLSAGPPFFFLRDPQSYTVPRLTSVFAFLTIDSFLGCTILVALLSFGGIWRLYQVFCEEYPMLTKELAIAFLFIPSLVFWGSGIMKDTYTFAAACWMTSSVYGLLLKQREIFKNIVYVVISTYIMINIKPYVFVALLPGCLIWVVFNRIQDVKNVILRVLVAPMIIMLGVVGMAFIFSQTSSSLGAYGSVDTIVEKAILTQEDLQREAYEGNSFNIGEIDPTAGGLLRSAPAAIFAGLFRPTILDTRNVVMFISAVENAALLLFLIYVLVKVGLFSFFRLVFAKPMILFSFVFAIFFAFAVGLTTSNFGSLVRYKIPSLPFFLASLYMIRYNRDREKQAESSQDDETLVLQSI